MLIVSKSYRCDWADRRFKKSTGRKTHHFFDSQFLSVTEQCWEESRLGGSWLPLGPAENCFSKTYYMEYT